MNVQYTIVFRKVSGFCFKKTLEQKPFLSSKKDNKLKTYHVQREFVTEMKICSKHSIRTRYVSN